MSRSFTLEEARALLDDMREEIDEIVEQRADLTAAAHDHRSGTGTVPLADLKAMEARLAELLDRVRARGIEIKGWAPLLFDFPGRHEGREVLFCWVEGEESIDWYHDAAHGFAGRRRVEDLHSPPP